MTKVSAVQMIGGNPRQGRERNDHYPTPYNVTVGLLRTGFVRPGERVWEPCCGQGAMATALEDYGLTVVSTDKFETGFGTGGLDATTAKDRLANIVITNPPFSEAADIIENLWFNVKVERMAMVLKSQFWHASRRTDLFRRTKPRAILALNWRPDFMERGGPTMDVIWTVWQRGYFGPTSYSILEKPL